VKKTFYFIIIFVLLFTCSLLVYSQKSDNSGSEVINIEVPVRVFNNGKFVNKLSLDDFIVMENGVKQKLEAVYLIKDKSIEKSEEKKRFIPELSKTYYLFFEIVEYTPRLGDSISYFINNVIHPDDTLIIVTPLKTYKIQIKNFSVESRNHMINKIKKVLRKDAWIGSSQYRNALDDLSKTAQLLSSEIRGEQNQTQNTQHEQTSMDEKLNRYLQQFRILNNLRKIDQSKILGFADYLKNKEGQKYVYIFYQREFLPHLSADTLSKATTKYENRPDIVHTLTRIFELYKRKAPINADLIKQKYSDSSVSIHFLFITRSSEEYTGIQMREHSEDLFSAFRKISEATGGYSDSSSRADILFKKGIESSKNYYLLYYSPKKYKKDGEYRQIQVKIKNKNYKINHRGGYYSD